MDSALPHFAEGAVGKRNSASGSASWSENFPRRGSLAILDLPAQLASSLGIEGAQTVLPVLEGAPAQGAWQDRRGSWAEHWAQHIHAAAQARQ